MSEPNTEVATAEEQKQSGEVTREGRYIPYGGGLLGWFENSGVPKNERGNNYKFHTAVDNQLVRRKLFERWGDHINRRAEQRIEIKRDIAVTIVTSAGSFESLTKDFSAHGLRLQMSEDPGVSRGDSLKVRVHEDAARTSMLMEIDSQVMWVAQMGRRRPLWNLGISFADISSDDELRLKEFLIGSQS